MHTREPLRRHTLHLRGCSRRCHCLVRCYTRCSRSAGLGTAWAPRSLRTLEGHQTTTQVPARGVHSCAWRRHGAKENANATSRALRRSMVSGSSAIRASSEEFFISAEVCLKQDWIVVGQRRQKKIVQAGAKRSEARLRHASDCSAHRWHASSLLC